MPMAIPLIAAVAAEGIAAAAFAGLSSFALSAIGAAASIAASAVMGSFNKPKSPDLNSLLNQAGAGRTQQLRQPVAPHQVIAGRIKASGVIVFLHTLTDGAGRANGWLYLVHAVSGVRVRAIYDVTLNETLASDASFGPHARVTAHLGASDQAADADFVSEIGDPYWGADHRLRGRAYLATRLVWDSALFGSGIPNITSIIEGIDDVYDPRTGLTAWHNNAALFIARWFTAPWGMGLAWADLDEDSVIAAANVCDERVRVGPGSATIMPVEVGGSPTLFTGAFTLSAGARQIDVGDGVRLTSSGTLPGGLSLNTTYYVIPGADGHISLAASAANAIAGTAVTITSAGSGTHTLTYWDEARYKLNGSWTLASAKGEVLKQLLSAMAGVAVFIGGKWHLHAGAAATPTITLTEDDLRGDYTYTPKRSMRDRFNGVRSVYANPDASWQPVDAPPLQSATYLAADDGEELYEDIRLPFTISTRAAQRLQKIALEINRREGVFQFPAKLTAMRLQPWDGVYLSIDRFGWTQKQFRVIGWTLADDGGVDLTLQEDDPDVYAWDASEERDSAIQQGVVLPDPSEIVAPAAVTLTTPTTPTFSNVMAQWSEVGSIWLDGYDVEYRGAGDTDWIGYGRVGNDVSREVSLERATPQDVRVRAVTKNGTPSDFTENLAPATPTSLAATLPSDNTIRIDADFDAATIGVQIFTGTASTASAATLLTTLEPDYFPYDHTGLASGTPRFYWLRAVSATGNFSALAGPVSATPTGTGGGS